MKKTISGFGLKRGFFALMFGGFVLLVVVAEPAAADLTNGDFSVDISIDGNGWEVTAGPVVWLEDIKKEELFWPAGLEPTLSWPDEITAVVFGPDGDALNSTLRQEITIRPELSVLSFDLVMGTGGDPQTDVFTAWLDGKLVYELSSDEVIDRGLDLFDTRFAIDVTSPSLLGPINDPVKVMLEFNLAHDYEDDSETWVLLDNVTLTPVPGAVVLGFLGLSAVGVKLRRYA